MNTIMKFLWKWWRGVLGPSIAFLALVGFACLAQAQTKSSATMTLTVTAAQTPAAVTITPPVATIQAGQTLSLNVTVAGDGSGSVPTGNVEILALPPGATDYVLVSTFPLINGKVACSYPIPATAPLGNYTVKAEYEGDGKYY